MTSLAPHSVFVIMPVVMVVTRTVGMCVRMAVPVIMTMIVFATMMDDLFRTGPTRIF